MSTVRRNTLPAFVVLFALTAAAESSPRHPFPQNLPYVEGSLKPDHRPLEDLNDDVRAAYRRWKLRYLRPAGAETDGHPRYRIATAASLNARTVSEGQGYGMIVVALMAGHEPDARAIFDGLWEFFNDHRSSIDDRLMDWNVEFDEAPDPEGNDSAFDGDADIAYGLLLAARQWGCSGRIDYCFEARDVIDGIMESEIGPESRLPMLGDWVDPDGETYHQYATRPSDFMPGHFRSFARSTGDHRWDEVASASLAAAAVLQSEFAPVTGLLPDFAVAVDESVESLAPAPAGFLEGPNDGNYSYNAGRTPWRLATDALLNGSDVSAAAATTMGSWIQSEAGGDPYGIRAGYTLAGDPLGHYFSTFFVTPFGVAAMLDGDAQRWLNDVYDSVRMRNQGYYEDSVTLLGLLVMTGNFWDPTLMMPSWSTPRKASGRVAP